MPRPIAADLARAVISPDDPAVAVRIIVIGRRIVEPPMKMVPVRDPMVKAAPAEYVTRAKAAAIEGRTAVTKTATMKGRAATPETAAMEAASTAVETTA